MSQYICRCLFLSRCASCIVLSDNKRDFSQCQSFVSHFVNRSITARQAVNFGRTAEKFLSLNLYTGDTQTKLERWQLTMYCHLRPPETMPLRRENFWVLGTLAT